MRTPTFIAYNQHNIVEYDLSNGGVEGTFSSTIHIHGCKILEVKVSQSNFYEKRGPLFTFKIK
jgi:hypothetical protein